MPSIGTVVIALFGYGFTLIVGMGSLVALRDFYRARKLRLYAHSNDELGTFLLGVVLTIGAATLTRWLVGGAI